MTNQTAIKIDAVTVFFSQFYVLIKEEAENIVITFNWFCSKSSCLLFSYEFGIYYTIFIPTSK